MRKFAAMTGIYSLSHFLVDFSCAYLIFSKLFGLDLWLECLLTYNFFAFAIQMPLGVLADTINRNRYFAALGCVFIIISPLFVTLPLLLCAIAGFGNALFHIGAGRDVLCGSGKSFSALGIFVSPGALGLFLGIISGKSEVLPLIAVLAVLLANAFAILLIVPKFYDKTEIFCESSQAPQRRKTDFLQMLLCLFLVVCLRSYVGITLAFPWKGEGSFALFLVISVVLGKAVGGIFADRFRALKTTFVSLLLCALLFLFYRAPFCGILAVFLFNMTMPITLGAVRKLMPNYLGFGFGLLTFGLFIGLVPAFLNIQNFLVLPYGYTAVAVISSGLLYYGLKERRYAA